ncbi:MAG: hypothetical protein WAW37_09160 [Syntrophobacteraceae bacterium]
MKSCFGKSFTLRSWDTCRGLAKRWREEGVGAAETGFGDGADDDSCPAVLFFKGNIPRELPWLSVFNSRKPRMVPPDAGWLEALRFLLKSLEAEGCVLAASTGTLTYDLVAAHAERSALPLVMVMPFSLSGPAPEMPGTHSEHGGCAISCLPATNACPKARRLVCRDRVLAAVSHAHLILELRSGGNLATLLEEQQKRNPRFQFIFDPGEENSSNAGNYRLIRNFSGNCERFSLPVSAGSREAGPGPGPARGTRISCPGPERIEWPKFLYHYTRGCPGPWPGQSQTAFLLSLLDNDPRSGHSALDTLLRIISERRIRAGFKLVRGRGPVISWSSHPPPEFCALRRWNPAFARWTVEPYGIAVSRDCLRGFDAKPAVYGGDETYRMLPESERSRFQSSAAGRAAWRGEREWRSVGDLELDRIGDRSWFAFVPTAGEKEKILDLTGPELPVVAFEEISTRPDACRT